MSLFDFGNYFRIVKVVDFLILKANPILKMQFLAAN